MEITVTEKVIETIYNSLLASKQSLKQQLRLISDKRKEDILKHQLSDVEEALELYKKYYKEN